MNNILEVLDGIKDKWKNIVLIVLSFLLISSIYNIFFINKEYEANVKIFIGKQKFKNITETYNNEEINLYQRLITTYSEVIKSKKLINESIKGSKMNYLQDKYKNINYDLLMENLTVNPIANTQIIEIKYKSLNPQQSYDLLYSITENLISYSKELYPNVNITVLEQVHVNLNQLMNKKLTIIGTYLHAKGQNDLKYFI